MGVVVGLLLGAGVACIWWSFWAQPPGAAAARAPGWHARTQDALVQAGAAGVTPGALVATSVMLGFVVLVLGTALTRIPSIALCFAVFAAMAPWALVRGRARRRRTRLRQLWPEVVDHLGSGIRAGLALPEAVAQIGERGPVELRPAFTAFAEDYRATGRFSESLDALKDRLADPVADRIVEALRLTRDVGGTDLGRLLRTLSAFLREDVRTRGELEARQSWTVNAARLAVAAPWIVLALLATRSEAAAAYDTPAGFAVLAVGGACTVVAYLVMLRIARLPDDPRVLR
ncbi:type II secretion system F family protein [Cellulomonas xylanilytica]|uniref:Type II secretion system protein F n=1 Tax=Cellulomonas xylanilytica TaxID=233583 RepID=A0A510V7K8_9CELL|nr:type II secretion system F family protein [Cellulomonas xylanilytica]GEK22858.1 type II secretion system protein F [Cellulomonas xylanilytica]